ncbi:MAG: hypothetical protein GX801_11455 [Fibrobacter sp.]|nr:hypothetical protein [Fibrobacter sp.]
MIVSTIIFYIIAALMVICALATVLVKNMLHSALFLVATFFSTAVLYLTMQAEFIAIAQVLVYIGGVVILVLFTVLLTSQLGEAAFISSGLRKYMAALIAGGFLVLIISLISTASGLGVSEATALADYANLDVIGERLLRTDNQGFILPFEIISLLLLTAMIGAIVIARRENPEEESSP